MPRHYDGLGRRFSYGGFRQAIVLPNRVQSDRAHAEYRQGALIVTMPKAGRPIKPMSTWRNRVTRSSNSSSSKVPLSDGIQGQIEALTKWWTKTLARPTASGNR